MKKLPRISMFFITCLCTFLFSSALTHSTYADQPKPVRVLVFVGGHGFNTNQFYDVFKANRQITFKIAEHPNAHALLKSDAAKDWDVLVLYDLWQNITEEAKSDLTARLKEGKGLVALHHSIANYQDWPEYSKIIGARYYTAPKTVNGVNKPRSQFKHGVDVPVQIADKKHSVSKGLKHFTIHDETYKLFDVDSDVRVLLTTTEPTSEPKLAWVKTYGEARVAYIQLGHDRKAYANPNFQRLLAQAIKWAAPKKN